jgi:hypothetical protein
MRYYRPIRDYASVHSSPARRLYTLAPVIRLTPRAWPSVGSLKISPQWSVPHSTAWSGITSLIRFNPPIENTP